MTTLAVISSFGSYARGQEITDPATVAAILAGPNRIYVVTKGDGSSDSGSGSSGGSGSTGGGTTTPTTPTTPSGLTLADVDGEVASALTARGLPVGTTVPGLITAAIAAQGSGSGVSAAQATALALVLG